MNLRFKSINVALCTLGILAMALPAPAEDQANYTGECLDIANNVAPPYEMRFCEDFDDFCSAGSCTDLDPPAQGLFLAEWPPECDYDSQVVDENKGTSTPYALNQPKGNEDYPDACPQNDIFAGTNHGRDISPVSGTDAEPLTLEFVLDTATERFLLSAMNFYVELTNGIDRAPTTPLQIVAGGSDPLVSYPYMPRIPWENGTNRDAIAFGVFAVLDTDPYSDLVGSNEVPITYQPAIYTGDQWYVLKGSIIDNVLPNYMPNGDVTLGARQNYLKLIITSNRIDIELRSKKTTADPYVTYTAHIEREMDRDENGTPDRFERLYTGPFTKIYFGNGGCISSPTKNVWLDDLALYGGCGQPQLTGAVSRKTHGTAGNWDIDVGAGDIECRSFQVGTVNPNQLKIVATFDRDVAVLGGAAAVTTDVGTVSSVVPGTAPNEVEVTITDLPLFGQVNLNFMDNPSAPTAGVVDTACSLDAGYASPSTLCVRMIVGDYDNLARTNFLDFAKIKNAGYLNQLVTSVDMARGDFDCNGRPNFLDFAKVKNAGLLNKTAAACSPVINVQEAALCADGIDNDGDGLTDCCDDDCAFESFCGNEVGYCADGIDNDCDGLVDLEPGIADPDCTETGAECTGGSDEDQDGLIDCADPDCSDDVACPENCTNGSDDDADGDVDCADSECVGDVNCPEVGNCSDGVDNDMDSLIDCLDPDCLGDAGCPEANYCFDGVDNDLDNLTDCADPQCVAAYPAICLAGTENNFSYPSSCTDGIDNDGDGITDCTDSDCVGDMWCFEGGYPGFSPPFCNDGVDNDNDGLTDCADTADCSTDIACSCGNTTCEPGYGENQCNCSVDCGTPPTNETACTDGIDEDCDGNIDCADADCNPSDVACDTSEDLVSCGDGIDNDGDGAVDCEDEECWCDDTYCTRPW